ncbi:MULTISPECIES: heavy metal sensor histidine kinase [unclassified Variovorax]|uniref:heavy metal sensor histidine kinase n=1 Tax=unclassified Variovorax TaxID=663243 RepID=UPI0008B2A1F5|nr:MULTISPECIES: heavy metal sensor histidine kinase [unclassified Variovorax]SEJ46897.1 two-component system, OmpR family, heavy metal sensor histidine kinase CusS [Variovorax sp. OK202]SFC47393.1 two-component system, OmpR family, heavy metal sensor histidine kinase CusS [Variovorax sp. OK212]
MSPRPHSLQRRLSLWLAAQTLFGLSVICLAIYLVTAWNFGQKQDEVLAQKAALVRHLLQEAEKGGDLVFLRHKLDDFFSMQDDVSLRISHAGRELFRSTPASSGRWLHRDLEVPWTQAGAVTPLSVELGMNVTQEARLLQRLAWTLLGAVVLGTALVSLTGMWLVRRGLRPLKALAERTAAMAPDRANQPIDAMAFAEELRPWITQFNALLLRVQRAYVQLESFNADVAHELRTPLANLIGATELALTRPRSNEELQGVLASNLEEVGRLSGIVTDMLFLSQAERGVPMRTRAATSLAVQAGDVIDFYDAMLEEAGLRAEVTGDATADVDAALVRRALFNLLGNAVRFAAPASVIRIEIGRDPQAGDAFAVTVANRGEPIDPAALPRLFERFYRAAQARDGSTRHHGLGLSIVEAIARMHGGRVFASSEDGETRIGFTVQRGG